MIVVTGMLVDFSMTSGLFNDIIELFGGERSPLLQNPDLYRTIYVASGIWQEIGWGSIIYLSALSGVDSQLYEAAQIDGAGKWKQLIHVTLPGIAPTIIIMFILKMGTLMNMGYEKQSFCIIRQPMKPRILFLRIFIESVFWSRIGVIQPQSVCLTQ